MGLILFSCKFHGWVEVGKRDSDTLNNQFEVLVNTSSEDLYCKV